MGDDRCIPGLTRTIVDAGASGRARLDDVAAPRACGRTRQDDLRKFSFQIWSKHSDSQFYTVDVCAEINHLARRAFTIKKARFTLIWRRSTCRATAARRGSRI